MLFEESGAYCFGALYRGILSIEPPRISRADHIGDASDLAANNRCSASHALQNSIGQVIDPARADKDAAGGVKLGKALFVGDKAESADPDIRGVLPL